MKLGKDTGSLVNYLQSGSRGQPIPEVGMGVTFFGWTDRNAGTIIKIWKQGAYEYITCQDDKAVRTDNNGLSEMQTYEHSPNPNGATRSFRRKIKEGPDGAFRGTYKNENGRWVTSESRMRLGGRSTYRDPSF